jgi:hypothetical protein
MAIDCLVERSPRSWCRARVPDSSLPINTVGSLMNLSKGESRSFRRKSSSSALFLTLLRERADSRRRYNISVTYVMFTGGTISGPVHLWTTFALCLYSHSGYIHSRSVICFFALSGTVDPYEVARGCFGSSSTGPSIHADNRLSQITACNISMPKYPPNSSQSEISRIFGNWWCFLLRSLHPVFVKPEK